MNDESIVFGLCWFQPEQWARLIEVSSDSEDLDDSYEEWRSNAHQALKEFQDAGKVVKKVKINIEELLLWCNEKGIPVDGNSRAEYVSYLIQCKNAK